MFQGHAINTLDEKGRIIIPSKFRKHITPEANNLMHVILGRDNCLWLYPSYEWTKLLKKIESLNPFLRDEIAMVRQMMYYAEECLIDSQHRILIPQDLLQKVDIKKEVLFIGQIEKIELWNEENYQSYLKGNKDTYEEVMEKVMIKIPGNTP
ncbi:MAG: division/cell wall cluster transcriptional repressor MraZ [Ignavibacteria bacterium]|jgi:MraZ protein